MNAIITGIAASTPDHPLPSTASIVAEQNHNKNAFCFDMGGM